MELTDTSISNKHNADLHDDVDRDLDRAQISYTPSK